MIISTVLSEALHQRNEISMPRSKSAFPDPVEVLKAVHHAGQSVMHAAMEILEDLDLNESQAAMLWALEPSTPPFSMRELANKLGFDPSNITLIADRLEQRGLIERTASPTDGRQRILALTPQGLRVWSHLIERIQVRSPLFTLSAAEQTELVRLLAKAQDTSKAPLRV